MVFFCKEDMELDLFFLAKLDLFFLVKRWGIFSELFSDFLTWVFCGPLMGEQAAVGKE